MNTFLIRFGIDWDAKQQDRREIGSAGRTTRPRFDLGRILEEGERPVGEEGRLSLLLIWIRGLGVRRARGRPSNEDDYPDIDLG